MRGLVQHVVRRDLLQPTGCSLQAGCSRSMLHTMVLGLTLPCPFPGCLQVGPKVGEGSFAVVHRGREVSGRGRDVAIKVVRSQGELGLHDDDPKGGCTYKDVLHSIILEINTLEVRCACAGSSSMHAGKHVQTYTTVTKPHLPAENMCCPTQAMGKHPNIVELFGQDRVDHVMVMEQASCDLYNLVKKMGSEKGVPEYMMRSWALCICAGVSHMHACGYVHQDLKSSNVLVFGDRTVTHRCKFIISCNAIAASHCPIIFGSLLLSSCC